MSKPATRKAAAYAPMTAAEYAKSLAALGLSQVKGGEFLGCNPRTSRRRIEGVLPVPRADALLLRTMIAHNLKPGDIDPAFKVK